MKTLLATNEVHLYTIDLTAAAQQTDHCFLLSPDEQQRAKRFHHPVHKQRFTAARSSLRIILSQYLEISPKEILFSYTDNNKPGIAGSSIIQFNLAHTHDLAIYAITKNQSVGVDVEKIADRQVEAIAKRFFSIDENKHLATLAPAECKQSFYQIWALKEALVKASGKGLLQPLASINISTIDQPSVLTMDNTPWYLVPFTISAEYASALASNQPIRSIQRLSLSSNHTPIFHGRIEIDEL